MFGPIEVWSGNAMLRSPDACLSSNGFSRSGVLALKLVSSVTCLVALANGDDEHVGD